MFTTIFISIDLYLISDIRYRYARSKEIPIGFKKDGNTYVKINPDSISNWVVDGKTAPYAKIA